jgi:predicted DNA-binding transcriptional regulator AlpA
MPEPNANAEPDILTDVEVARLLRCSNEKVRRWRYSAPPRGPRYFRLDRSVRYRRSDVLDFMEKVLVGTQQQPLVDSSTPSTKRRGRRAA